MSAFILSNAHLSAVIGYACRKNIRFSCEIPGTLGFTSCAVAGNEDEIFAELASQNARSVGHRYALEDDEVASGSYILTAPKLSAIEVIKAAQCIDYQSCEHPEWSTSKAKRFIDAVVSSAISDLPGYGDAKWSIY